MRSVGSLSAKRDTIADYPDINSYEFGIFLLQLTEVAPPEPAKPREYFFLSLILSTLRVVG